MTGVRRFLTIAAVVATVVGLPAILIGGALLRHVGHVAPSVTNVVELRLRVLGHGVGCDDPRPDKLVTDGNYVVSTLTCGTGDRALRLETFRNESDRGRARYRGMAWVVEGANWRIYAADEQTAKRLAHALTGRAAYHRA